MRYRIIHLHRISLILGDGEQFEEFDAPNDEIAELHFEYELRHTFADKLVLVRIDKPEISTELKFAHRPDDYTPTESGQ